jgi:hypothetical protein
MTSDTRPDLFGRGECYEYVKNKILKDRRDVPVW